MVDLNEVNVRIGDKYTFNDWGLKLSSMTIEFPETKKNLVNIPGADGSIDLTEALGDVAYKNRQLEFVFDALGAYENWHVLCTDIADYLHGRTMKIILDTDPYYYYLGRLDLETEKTDDTIHEIVLSGEVDPYKYELQSSMEDWLWGPFNFRTGIIRNYKNLNVNGSRTVNIIGRRKPIVPTIISDADMTVAFNGKTYRVRAGEQKIYRILIREGNNYLTFSGKGTISIDYRGGIL